jgi:hypothetical protein
MTINPTDLAVPTELDSILAQIFGGGAGTAAPTGTNDLNDILGAIFPLGGGPPTEEPTPTGEPVNFFTELATGTDTY